MKRFLIGFLCLGLGLVSLVGYATAATEAEKRAAIDAGLAWLAADQNVDGSWYPYSDVYYKTSATGAALLAFIEEKANWGGNAAAYQAVVDNGLTYLLNQAQPVTISSQPAGNPDGDGNGVGVKFVLGGTNSRDTYVTGLALPAIAASGTPDALVTTGALASWTDGSGAGGAWTYKDVVQMGVATPNFVKTELDYWIDAIQYPDGGAGYTPYPGTRYGEMNETGALLIEQAFRGMGVGNSAVDAALNYIDDGWKWALGSGGSYDGNIGHPYAMWAIYKGLELTIGLDADTSIIGNLRADPGDVDNPNHGYNWWEDYCEYLVGTQLANGSWNGYSSWNSWLATPWYINILAATKIPGPGPDPIPEPTTMLLLGAGLLGLGALRKKVKKA